MKSVVFFAQSTDSLRFRKPEKSRSITVGYGTTDAECRSWIWKGCNFVHFQTPGSVLFAAIVRKKVGSSFRAALMVSMEVPIESAHPIDFDGRWIHRCARSTVAAEGTASANLIEVGVRVQMLYCELICGRCFDIRIREEGPAPLSTTFGPEEIMMAGNVTDRYSTYHLRSFLGWKRRFGNRSMFSLRTKISRRRDLFRLKRGSDSRF